MGLIDEMFETNRLGKEVGEYPSIVVKRENLLKEYTDKDRKEIVQGIRGSETKEEFLRKMYEKGISFDLLVALELITEEEVLLYLPIFSRGVKRIDKAKKLLDSNYVEEERSKARKVPKLRKYTGEEIPEQYVGSSNSILREKIRELEEELKSYRESEVVKGNKKEKSGKIITDSPKVKNEKSAEDLLRELAGGEMEPPVIDTVLVITTKKINKLLKSGATKYKVKSVFTKSGIEKSDFTKVIYVLTQDVLKNKKFLAYIKEWLTMNKDKSINKEVFIAKLKDSKITHSAIQGEVELTVDSISQFLQYNRK